MTPICVRSANFLFSPRGRAVFGSPLRNNEDLNAARGTRYVHLRFVVHLARSYKGYGLSQADLIQEGNVGLMKAVKRLILMSACALFPLLYIGSKQKCTSTSCAIGASSKWRPPRLSGNCSLTRGAKNPTVGSGVGRAAIADELGVPTVEVGKPAECQRYGLRWLR